MNKHLYTLAACVALCSTQQAIAQKLRAGDEQHILLKVVELFEDYESYSAIDNSYTDYENNFCDLFVSNNSTVYNDIVGLVGDKQTLTVDEYAKTLVEQSSTTRTVIRNIRHLPFHKEGGVWKLECTFDKSVNITDKHGVEYASDYLYRNCSHQDYHLKAFIRYDEKNNACRFEKIECVDPNAYPLPAEYRVLKFNSNRDRDVTVDGTPLGKGGFNAMQQAFIPAGASLATDNPEIGVRLVAYNPDAEDQTFYKFKYVPHRWRLKAHYDLTAGNFYNTSSSLDGLTQKSTAAEFGLDLGFLYAAKGKMRYSLNLGVGYSASSMQLDLGAPDGSGEGALDYHYSCSEEADGITYERYYEGVTAHEDVKVESVVFPFNFDFEYTINKYVSAYLQVGVKNYYNLSSSLTNTTHINNIYGVFPAPYNMIVGDWHPYDGFRRDVTLDNSSLVDPTVHVNKYSLDATAGLGVRLHPAAKLPLYIEAGAYYQMSVLDPFDLSTSRPVGTASTPLSTYHLDADPLGPGYEQVNSLTSSFDKWRRQAIKINLGLIYKF